MLKNRSMNTFSLFLHDVRQNIIFNHSEKYSKIKIEITDQVLKIIIKIALKYAAKQ